MSELAKILLGMTALMALIGLFLPAFKKDRD